MIKKHIYFFPGLGASSKIFEYISLPKDQFEIHLLEWKIPESINESIGSYAGRMCKEVHHDNPILIGVSFGGILVQEMSKIIKTEKIIIISSIKSEAELPTTLKILRDTKAYKLLPVKIVQNIEDYTKYFIGDYLKKRAELYKMYLSVRNTKYMQWAIHNVLNWKQKEVPSNLVHIHGERDTVFPVKFIENYIPIEKGTHVMIIHKAKTISKLISENLK